MKICLIGPGTTIPPISWGACEIIVWEYYNNLLQLGIDVHFISVKNNNNIISFIKNASFDVVHIMYDDLIHLAPRIYKHCRNIVYTTHWAYLPQIYTRKKTYKPFDTLLKNKKLVKIFPISKSIYNVYLKAGISAEKLHVVRNGANHNLFKFQEHPKFPSRTIYVGKIELRKRQFLYQKIKSLFFVGNYYNSPFNTNSENYLGSWTKDKLYTDLTDYANILLISDGEADPLVIKEALMAGLGVVCNEISAANLDKTKKFISIIPNHKYNDIDFIEKTVEENRKTSIEIRNEIRQYAEEQFSWANIIKNIYLPKIKCLCSIR